ncbi:hypothetical protein SNE40_000403 [Patella caerulea]|uniref:Uncharacterized protein n=1 Tax=Patella caerulea TaxID=87958 RepID=A0AAN8KAE7_PATCE
MDNETKDLKGDKTLDKKPDPVLEQPYTPASLIVNNSVRDVEGGVESFSMEPHIQNTEKNRHVESNTILPYLVRRMDSEELLPRPWKSTNQIIIVSYISILFCCFIGAAANHYAWKAKKTNNESRYHETKKFANNSVKWIYSAFACGIIIATGFIVIAVLLRMGN